MSRYRFFNRDVSWLYFNERVLTEAGRENVPLLERMKFLAIYSSNLDEFYRVRIPAIKALKKLQESLSPKNDTILEIDGIVKRQQKRYGEILIPLLLELKSNNISLLYKETLPAAIELELKHYFFTQVLTFLQPMFLHNSTTFFPENNKLYLAISLQYKEGHDQLALLNIPSDKLSRFFTIMHDGIQYIIFLDDIIKKFLPLIFKNAAIQGAYSFKTTRDAELNIKDEYDADVAAAIETELLKRDYGLATRFLFDTAMPQNMLEYIVDLLKLKNASCIEGGTYHNLKDFAELPVHIEKLLYENMPPLQLRANDSDSLFSVIEQKDIMLHAPWQSYDTVLRFFNEAASNNNVKEIYCTLYRVARDSRIVNAMISAAKNGKKVFVLVELKARFDEANNIKWAKTMKAAGVKIIYSSAALKVHAKIALIKMHKRHHIKYLGLLATGNLNEGTARFYTDHILLTARTQMLAEMEQLFLYLVRDKKNLLRTPPVFKCLLVAQFNLQEKFLTLIDREIANAKKGLVSGIVIKLNNLEEKTMIRKLYQASCAGVKIQLIVRAICCLIPGIAGQSENITVRRIVDRYLEHGRVFIFNNNNKEEIYLGSADWMNRNIYKRIEVCFPLYDSELCKTIRSILTLQLTDNVQAVYISPDLENIEVRDNNKPVQSQKAIYEFLKAANNEM